MLHNALACLINYAPNCCAVLLRKETLVCLSYLAKVVHFTVSALIHTNLVSWKVLLE